MSREKTEYLENKEKQAGMRAERMGTRTGNQTGGRTGYQAGNRIGNRTGNQTGSHTGKWIIFWLAALAALAFCGGLFLLNCNRITYREHIAYEGDGLQELMDTSGDEAVELHLPDSLEILQQAALQMKAGAELPASIALYHADGELVQEMPVMETNGREVVYRVSYRKRPFQKKGDYLLLKGADGKAYDLTQTDKFTLYGGSRARFWVILSVIFTFFILLFFLRAYRVLHRGNAVFKDAWIRSILVGTLAFCSIAIYASLKLADNLDEMDNMIGGMILAAQHKVIYRDYITQHTPVAYWLGWLYALLGAQSVEQFRLLLHVSYGVIWGLVWFRHKDSPRSRAVALMAPAWGFFSHVFIAQFTGTMLSDNIQGLAMAVLLLELVGYFEDHALTLARMVIVSLCIFASVGSAFISIYAIAAAALAVLAADLFAHRKKGIGFFAGRYVLLFGIIAVPFVLSIVYFAANGALKTAFDQAYRFNVEVYPNYTGGFGTDKLAPVKGAFRTFYKMVRRDTLHILNHKTNITEVVQMVMTVLALLPCLVNLLRRRVAEGIGIFFFIIMQAIRDTQGFHSGMLWHVVTMYALLNLPGMGGVFDQVRQSLFGTGRAGDRTRAALPVLVPVLYMVLILVWIGKPYYYNFRGLMYERMMLPDVSERDLDRDRLMGENEPTFYTTTSLFLLYKGHYPVNRLVWLFPWYCEWFEEEAAQQLEEALPKTAIYDPEDVIWKRKYFTPHIKEVIDKYYEPSKLEFVYSLKPEYAGGTGSSQDVS